MPRSKTKHKKFQKIEDDDGWTHVVRGPRLPSTELGRAATGSVGDELSRIEAESILSLEQVRNKYAKTQQYWEEDPLRHDFEKIFNGQVVTTFPNIAIDNALVLGLGPIAIDNMDSKSMYQLVLFEYWIKFLRTKYTIPKVYFQDPWFCANDRAFLEELGYSVIEDPEAYLVLTPTTFLFAPYLPWEITHTFLQIAFPALFVGNDMEFHWSMALLRERQTILQSPKIKEFYSSHRKVDLDCRNFSEVWDGPKHAQWLTDIFVWWSLEIEQSCGKANSLQRSYDEACKNHSTLEDQMKPKPPSLPQKKESSEDFSFRAGQGEWRSDGFHFDPELWTKILDARQQRALRFR